MDFLKALEGKKTYLTMAVIIILGGLEAYNQHCVASGTCSAFQVPGFVFTVLGFLGVYTRKVAK